MAIPMIGSVSNFVKSMALEKKWQDRKKNPGLAKGNDSFIDTYVRQLEESRQKQTLSSIEAKMKSGLRLSGADMEYLRKNAPELYKKALELEKEREGYRRALRECRTKEQVQRLYAHKMHEYLNEARLAEHGSVSTGDGQGTLDDITMRVAAIQNEHNIFLSTPEYARLPHDYELGKKDKPPKTSTRGSYPVGGYIPTQAAYPKPAAKHGLPAAYRIHGDVGNKNGGENPEIKKRVSIDA